jgi:hypothetical protein
VPLVVLLLVPACGGGGGGSSAGSSVLVRARFLGAAGTVVTTVHANVDDADDPNTWTMEADGEGTFSANVPVVPGHSLYVNASSIEADTFWITYVFFEGVGGEVDLGTIDLRTHGLAPTAPADGATLSTYPVEFTWSPYDRGDVTPTYHPVICCWEAGHTGCVQRHTGGETTDVFTATDATNQSWTGTGSWGPTLKYVSPEGYEVEQQLRASNFTFPPPP